jgi:hypothetical protein
MTDFSAFLELGWRHILDLAALDHILFLLVLAVIYRWQDWRNAVWVVTAFTIGHSVTLGLAVTGLVALPTALIEFLIPVTIVLTALDNLRERDPGSRRRELRLRPVFAGVFGLVHGAGFANYLNSLFLDQIALPLLGFNVGIELGQIVVLLAAFAAFAVTDRLIGVLRRPGVAPSPYRLRVLGISTVVALFAARWAFERSPW